MKKILLGVLVVTMCLFVLTGCTGETSICEDGIDEFGEVCGNSQGPSSSQSDDSKDGALSQPPALPEE
jgi:hypothetical protein